MDEDGFELLMTARTPMEAQLVYGILDGEGIRVRIPGAVLADEWAASLQAAGVLATEVLVARQDVSRAREVLAEFRTAAQETPEGGGDADEPDEGRSGAQ